MSPSCEIRYDRSQRGRRIRFSGNPFALVLVILATAWIILACVTALDLVLDLYGAYEGTVLRIGGRWTDWVVLDPADWEHLTLQTPRGKIVDKTVTIGTRLAKRIRVGDYIVKEKGFRNRPRVRAAKGRDAAVDRGAQE